MQPSITEEIIGERLNFQNLLMLIPSGLVGFRASVYPGEPFTVISTVSVEF